MIDNPYLWMKALHLISLISWMAGMLYLPRLFVYHTQVPVGSEASETFKVMERRLLRYIMTPAMILTFVFGIILIVQTDAMNPLHGLWMHIKLGLVLAMAALHGMMAGFRKKFERDANTKSAKFYKIFNEIPTVLMIVIILLVVLKPF